MCFFYCRKDDKMPPSQNIFKKPVLSGVNLTNSQREGVNPALCHE
jgi:hypothetical protein